MPQADRRTEVLLRFVGFIQTFVRDRAQNKNVDVVGLDLDHFVEIGERLKAIALLQIGPGAAEMGVGIAVHGSVEQAKLVQQVRPVYPPEAKQAGISGVVRLAVVIGADGKVRNIQVMNGEPQLAAAAMEAVRQWVWQPKLLKGEPVEVSTTVDVNFTLSGK